MLAFHSYGLRLSAAKGVRAGASILVRTEILKARIEFGLEQGVSMKRSPDAGQLAFCCLNPFDLLLFIP